MNISQFSGREGEKLILDAFTTRKRVCEQDETPILKRGP